MKTKIRKKKKKKEKKSKEPRSVRNSRTPRGDIFYLNERVLSERAARLFAKSIGGKREGESEIEWQSSSVVYGRVSWSFVCLRFVRSFIVRLRVCQFFSLLLFSTFSVFFPQSICADAPSLVQSAFSLFLLEFLVPFQSTFPVLVHLFLRFERPSRLRTAHTIAKSLSLSLSLSLCLSLWVKGCSDGRNTELEQD